MTHLPSIVFALAMIVLLFAVVRGNSPPPEAEIAKISEKAKAQIQEAVSAFIAQQLTPKIQALPEVR